jgi:predicted  nucleic acid-binding Zn-ribbon protein
LRAQIEILASLQMLDREIKDQKVLRQGMLRELESQEQEILEKKKEVELIRAEWLEKEKLRQAKERVLQEEGKKAMDKRMRMSRIKNVKELQALQREIEQIRQANGELEEEIIKMLEELEAVKATVKGKDDELAKLKEQWEQKQELLSAEISGIDQKMTEACSRRQTIASQINGDLISRYELIFARRGGTAVVEVTGGICQGCYMNIPPQLWNEIIRSDKMIVCPSCQRILYHKPVLVEEKPA